MALSRMISNSDLLTTLPRITHAACTSLTEMQCTRYAAVHQSRIKGLHFTSVRRYPDAPALPLPINVSEIFANETGRFTPERSRDITAPILIYGKDSVGFLSTGKSKESCDRPSFSPMCVDTHVDSYDCFGAVSLNGSMQSNVPKPFSSCGKSTHLNMPGGQWSRDGKYLAEDMQKSHYRSVVFPTLKNKKNGSICNTIGMCFPSQITYRPIHVLNMEYSTNVSSRPETNENSSVEQQNTASLSKREKFKKAIKDYGSTVIIFHIGISLLSLGAFYTAVVSGLDIMSIVKQFTGGGNEQLDKLVGNSSNFLVAYTVHKLFAPVRLSITIGVTPLLVRYLRRIGILKPPKLKPT